MKRFHLFPAALAAAAAMLCAPTQASAQTAVYGMFTGAGPGIVNTSNIYGGTFGAYFDRGTLINGGIDIRGTLLSGTDSSNHSSTAFDSGLAGLRLSVKPHIISLNPYGELLGGFARQQYGEGISKTTNNAFAYQANVGVDFTVLPHIDWRILEFAYTGTSNGGEKVKGLSSGIVIRFF